MSPHGEKLLRRLSLGLAVAVLGLIVGTLMAPSIKARYYFYRTSSSDIEVRLDALNELAGLARGNARNAPNLVDALLNETVESAFDLDSPAGRIAIWSIQHVEAVEARCIALLQEAGSEEFSFLAGALEHAGRWTPGRIGSASRIHRELLRLQMDDPQTRIIALKSLARIGPVAQPDVQNALLSVRADPVVAVRRQAVWTASICLDASTSIPSVLVPALDDLDDEVCLASIWALGVLDPVALADHLSLGRVGQNVVMAEAAMWAIRSTPEGRELALGAMENSEPAIRRMAVWTLGFVPDENEGVVLTLAGLLKDPEVIIRARAALALGRRFTERADVNAIASLLRDESVDVNLAAMYALGRCRWDEAGRATAIKEVRGALAQAIQSGDLAAAAASIEALADLNDQPYMQVILDVVTEFQDQPMLQYRAACAAHRLNAAAGTEALLDLCGAMSDEVRELTALRVARFQPPLFNQLMEILVENDTPANGGSALALALAGERRWLEGRPLAEELARRMQPAEPDFEPTWQVRANYLAARMICGDPDARAELDVYLVNGNVSRTGLFLALLESGDISPAQAVLNQSASIEADSFFRDAGFVEVLRAYFDEPPLFEWTEDQEIRRFLIERLGDWLQIKGPRLQFEPAEHKFKTKG